MATSRTAPAPRRAARTDGEATRLHILDTAGRVFAERGYANTTSKDICVRAGTNMASVNYHFGGRDALYEAVLLEAHRQLLDLDQMAAIAGAAGDPRAKLRSIVGGIIRHVGGPAGPWGLRVLTRELLAPTPFAPAMIKKAIAPKAKLMLGIIGEILGVPPTHPAAQRSLAFIMTQCMGLLLAPKDLEGSLPFSFHKDPDALADDLLRFALAGLDALAAHYRP